MYCFGDTSESLSGSISSLKYYLQTCWQHKYMNTVYQNQNVCYLFYFGELA